MGWFSYIKIPINSNPNFLIKILIKNKFYILYFNILSQIIKNFQKIKNYGYSCNDIRYWNKRFFKFGWSPDLTCIQYSHLKRKINQIIQRICHTFWGFSNVIRRLQSSWDFPGTPKKKRNITLKSPSRIFKWSVNSKICGWAQCKIWRTNHE